MSVDGVDDMKNLFTIYVSLMCAAFNADYDLFILISRLQHSSSSRDMPINKLALFSGVGFTLITDIKAHPPV